MELALRKGNSLFRNIFSLALVQVANYVFPIITFPFIVRIIGPDKFGAINFVAAVTGYFVLFINYGFDLTATRRISCNRSNSDVVNQIFNAVVQAKVILLLLSIIGFLVLLFTLPQLKAEKTIAVFSFIICLAWVLTPNWLYQGMQDLHRMAIFNFIEKLVFTIIIILLIRKKEDYIWQPLATSAAQICVGVSSFLWAVRKYKLKFSFIKPINSLKLLWNEKVIFFSTVVISLYSTTNIVILGLLKTNEDVAFYSAGWKLITILQSLIAFPLSQSLFPVIGETFGKGKEVGIDTIKKILPLIAVFTFIAGISCFIFSPLIIFIFYGSAFENAISVLRILAFVPFVVSLSNLFGIQTMINLKMDHAFFKITFAGAVIGLIANFFLSENFGYKGTAVAWLSTEIFITVTMYFFLWRNKIHLIHLPYFNFKYLKGYLISIIK